MSMVIAQGNARELPLEDNSVDLICTSPPYWKLRDYRDGGESLPGQIGAEGTPQEYVASLVACTREWMRVLKPTGSLFVNLGDKRASRWASRSEGAGLHHVRGRDARGGRNTTGVPDKSLLGLPWRYALRCIDELGLTLRTDLIDDEYDDQDGGAYVWHKVNGKPESVTDRVKDAHEYVFHLVQSRRYFAAVDEIREPHTEVSRRRAAPHRADPGRAMREGRPFAGTGMNAQTFALAHMLHPLGSLPGSVWRIPTQPLIVPDRIAHARCCGGVPRAGCKDGLGHYAAFPLELARRIILAWSPSGICDECGEGRKPVTVFTGEQGRHPGGGGGYRAIRAPGALDTNLAEAAVKPRVIAGYACECTPYTDHPATGDRNLDVPPEWEHGPVRGGGFAGHARDAGRTGPWREYHLEGWQPPTARPAVVLDPCAGTGSTLLVAEALGRDSIGIDLSADYCGLARWRTTDPGERARALGVPKPPPVPDGALTLFDVGEVGA